MDLHLPNFDELWNYNKPADTEQQFRGLLGRAEQSGNVGYYLQLLTQLARSVGLQGRFEEAHAILDQVAPQVGIGLVVEVRYLLERGRVFNSSKKPTEALPLFRKAWEMAQAAKEDDFAVDAAHMVAIAEADPEEKLRWNLKALAKAEESVQARAKKWKGSLYNNIGWTYHDMGEYEKALDLFQKALRWHEAEGKPENVHIAKWSVARTLRSLNRVQEALTMQEGLLMSDPTDGFVHEEIGECLLALGRGEEAKPYFGKAAELLGQFSWVEAERVARLKELST